MAYWAAFKRSGVLRAESFEALFDYALKREFDVSSKEEMALDHSILVPLHFLTPRYDLPVIPVNINCQGPPLTPLARAYEFGRTLRSEAKVAQSPSVSSLPFH